MLKQLNFLEVENFISFRKHVRVPLSNRGLVYIRGDNQVSNSSDSNGVGKTTLVVDALSWCFFGQTFKGSRADSVINRFSTEKKCYVSVGFRDSEDRDWTVIRERPHRIALIGNSVKFSGQEAEQVLSGLLGFGFRTFSNAMIFGQGAFSRFADANQAEKLKIFDEILGVDFKRLQDFAKSKRQLAESGLEAIRGLSQSTERSIAEITETINELQQARASFLDSREKELSDIRAKIAQAKQKVSEALSREAQFEKGEQKLLSAKRKLSVQDTKRAEIESLSSQIDTLIRHAEKLKSKKDFLESSVANVLQQGLCPSCFRPAVTRAQKADVQAAFEPHLNEIALPLETIQTNLNLLTAKLKKCQSELSDIIKNDGLEFTEKDVQKLRMKYGPDAKRFLDSIVTSARKHVEDLSNLETSVASKEWDGAETLRKLTSKVSKLTEELKSHKLEVVKASKDVAIADYWVTAFGDRGIRSMFLDGVSEVLNSRLAYHLQHLACGEAHVVVSPQSENAKGDKKEKFTVDAQWDWGAEEYYEGSGGQERRVDLAIFLALQDLAEKSSGLFFPIRIFDQPEEGLDARGLELFGEWMKSEAKKRGTAILITHNPILADSVLPDEIWTIRLTEEGSDVEISTN